MITDDFGYWFAGFTDGEGSFIIDRHIINGKKYYNCIFALALRADDTAILEKIKENIGFGIVYKYTKRDCYSINHKPSSRYVVTGKMCQVIVGLFDRFLLRSKKLNDYKIWREAVMERMKGKRNDEILMEYYFNKIREVRKYDKITTKLKKPEDKQIDMELKIA